MPDLTTAPTLTRAGHTEHTDEELLRLVASGRESALAELYQRHGARSLAFARRMVGDHDTAEEVVQDSFVAVWRRAPTFNDSFGSAKTWFMSIVRNRAIDELRRRSRRVGVTPLDDSREPAVEQGGAGDPLRRVEYGDLATALRTIPPAQRRVIELSYFDGYSLAEVAQLTGVSAGTVKSRVRLALARLRKQPLLADPERGLPASEQRIEELIA